jgi:type II secretory pathway pseudopilin PulG
VVSVIARLHRTKAAEDGFTMLELSVAAFLSSIVLGAVVLIFSSVSKGATDAGERAELQMEVREVATDLATELRSAVSPGGAAAAIESLSAGSLAFYSDRYEFAGPERIVYDRAGCSGDYCSLRVRRYAANAGSGPNWTFSTVPFNDVVLLEQISATNTLFAGRVWSGGERVAVASCGGGSRCDFPIVAVDLQAAAPGVSTLDGLFGIFVEVSLRNA